MEAALIDLLLSILRTLVVGLLLLLAVFGLSLVGGGLLWLSFRTTGVWSDVLEGGGALLVVLGPFLSIAWLVDRGGRR